MMKLFSKLPYDADADCDSCVCCGYLSLGTLFSKFDIPFPSPESIPDDVLLWKKSLVKKMVD